MQKDKIVFIENLRIFLISLVILHHLACTYGGVGTWYYSEIPQHLPDRMLFTVFAAVNQSFFMGLFFLISAYFSSASLGEKGALKYLTGRLRRLGIPLFVFLLVISPVTQYAVLRFKGHGPLSLWQYIVSGKGMSIGPLWFVEALLYFSVAYVIAHFIGKRFGIKISRPSGMPGASAVLIGALIVALTTSVVRLKYPVDAISTLFNFRFSYFPQYIFMFVVGIMAHRNQWFTSIPFKTGLAWLAFGLGVFVLVTPVILYMGGALSGRFEPYYGGWHWQAFAFALWEQLLGFSMIFGLLSVFRNKLCRQGPWLEGFSDSAYAVFIIHTPIIVGLCVAVRDVALPPVFKFVLLGPVCIAASFLSAWTLRKIPVVGRVI